MFDYHEKKILASFFYIEMHKCGLSASTTAEELTMPEKIILQVLTGDVLWVTKDTIFDMIQKIYHGSDIVELDKERLLIELKDHDSLIHALHAVYKQDRFKIRNIS
jgi:hypothetical protein